MTTIYHYHPASGEYTASTQAQMSPLEPDVPLIPAHATTQAPPQAGAHQAAVFDAAANKWQLVPDWRGVQLYSTADGSEVAAELWQTPADCAATDKPRPSEAHIWKTSKWVLDAAKQAALDAAQIAELAKSIDSAVAALYAQYTRFEVEYLEREKQALAYKAAGYTGTVPTQVAAFATPSGKTGKQAADIILTQAAALRGALEQLGVLRMRKIEVQQAATPAAAQALAEQITAAVRQIGEAL